MPGPGPTEQPATPPRPAPGKGGPQHKYAQTLIKKWGEERGYRAMIEYAILGGTGSVDVALERGGELVLACKISIASTPEQELGNVLKCLTAGFAQVAVVSADPRASKKAAKVIVSAVNEADRARVLFVTPEEVLDLIETLATTMPETETTVRGYKVKTRHQTLGAKEKSARQKVLSQVVVESMKRLQGKDE